MFENLNRNEVRNIVSYALDDLYEAKNELQNARGLGIVDILGGGFFSSLLKHNRIDEAQKLLRKAKRSLSGFGYELVEAFGLNNIEMIRSDSLNGVADIFFDNAFSDISIQSKIKDNLVKIEDSIERMEYFLNGLN